MNLQGDVVEIRNSDNGIVVARYLYNAWGELLEYDGWFAEHNPLRYRGYYQCLSSGFYYLQSRYYCPTIGRFINADDMQVLGVEQGNLLEFNLFAYCLNNPVNGVDSEGYFFQALKGAAVGAVVGVIMEVGRQVIFEGARSLSDLDGGAILIEAGNGAATGALMSMGLPPNVITTGRAAINATTAAFHTVRDGERNGDSDWTILGDTVINMCIAIVGTRASNRIFNTDQRTSVISSGRRGANPRVPVWDIFTNRGARFGLRSSGSILDQLLGPRRSEPSRGRSLGTGVNVGRGGGFGGRR